MKKTGLVLMVIVLSGFLSSCQQPKTDNGKKKDYEVEVKIKELEPDDSFYKAEKAYIDQDFMTSATEIMNGVHYMKQLLPFAPPGQEKELQRSIEELTDFAEDVRGDRINGFKDFEFFFARAGRALSEHHLNISEIIAGQGNDYKEAARELIKAIHFLRYSYVKSGQELPKNEQAQLRNYKKFAKNVIEDQRVDNIKKAFNNAFKNVSGQIIQLGGE